MKPEFNYNSLPSGFANCFNEQCKRADKCLRRQAALHIPAEYKIISIVNPACIASTGEDCLYFKADNPQLFARGITCLLSSIPHSDAIAIKQQMLNHFGRTLFYRFWRKEHLFSPSQQEYVKQLFLQRGISEPPLFDEYIEQYEW